MLTHRFSNLHTGRHRHSNLHTGRHRHSNRHTGRHRHTDDRHSHTHIAEQQEVGKKSPPPSLLNIDHFDSLWRGERSLHRDSSRKIAALRKTVYRTSGRRHCYRATTDGRRRLATGPAPPSAASNVERRRCVMCHKVSRAIVWHHGTSLTTHREITPPV